MTTDLRDELAEAVQYGRISPDDADAKLKGMGLAPLAPQPDPAKYDPMCEVWWTLPMTLAWIAWRTTGDVREAWDVFRREGSIWLFEKWKLGFDGPINEGWNLRPKAPARLSFLALSETWRRNAGTLPNGAVSIADAKTSLWQALGAGALQATGISTAGGPRVPIPDHEWCDFAAIEEKERDVVRYRQRHGYSRNGYDDLALKRRDIMDIWPPSRIEQCGLSLPPTMLPHGPGYMPLYCAAQWIATEGGARDFAPTYSAIWERAYADLLAHISTDQVAVTGVRGGAREELGGYLFASIAVSYPFADTSFDLLVSDELHLELRAYLDDEHWRNGFDDHLRDRHGIRWSQLMVPKTDVARCWPFSNGKPVETHSGAPGRPSAMHLVIAEYRARKARGEADGRLHVIASELAEWASARYPGLRTPKAGTIANALRTEHRQSTK